MHWPPRHGCRRWNWGLVLLSLLALLQAVPARAEEALLVDKPVVGRNADGHLELFRVNAEGQLEHRWQKLSNGDWSAWSSLGGPFCPGLAVASNSAAQLEVFAVQGHTHELWQAHQLATNATEWSDWSSLGGDFAGPVAAEADAQGRLHLFAVSASGWEVKQCCQTNAGGGWGRWADMGGPVLPDIVAAHNRSGRLELFGVGALDHSLLHCWQHRATTNSTWSAWHSLGSAILPGFAVGRNAVGRLEVFAVNLTNRHPQRILQVLNPKGWNWTPWLDFSSQSPATPPGETAAAPAKPLGGLPEGEQAGRGSADTIHPAVSAVETGLAVGQSADHRMEVFAVASGDGTLLHRWETLTDGSDRWSRWASLGEAARPPVAVVANEDGDLEVFAQDRTNANVINHRRQISNASDWLDWSSLSRPNFEYSSRTWQTDEGLPNNVVQAIAQTRDGYLWVGTLEGLARFDGVSFTAFGAPIAPELEKASITALCADRQGALWVGTEGGGLLRLDSSGLVHYGVTNGLAGDEVHAIYQSRDGAIWVGTSTGLSRYENGRFSTYRRQQGLLSDLVRALHQDRAGHLWIATGAGLNRLSGGTMDNFLMPNNLPNDSVRCIWQDRGGRIWIGSNNGLLWYNWFWLRSFYAYNTKYGLSDSFVSAICDDQEGNLWVGTYSGLNLFHEGRFYPQLNNEGVPFDKINALFEDHDGNLWVGSRDGLARLTPKRFNAYSRQQGLTHNNVTSVLEDHAGNLWLGTWGGGLNRIKDEKVTAYLTSAGSPANVVSETGATNRFPESLVLALCEGRDGSLWVGTDFDGGLLHLQNGHLTHYTWRDGLLNGAIRVLHQDRAGILWVGTSRGLCRRQGDKFTLCAPTNSLGQETIRAICQDQAGRLWFGTDSGLSCWQSNRLSRLTTRDGLSDNHVRALYEDGQQNLWIGTAGGGLDRVTLGPKKRDKGAPAPGPWSFHAVHFTTRQGLFSDEVFEILEDDQGWLWMSCSKGVFRVRKQDLLDLERGKLERVACTVYGKADGLETTQFNGVAQPAGCKTRDGRLWFPTSKGVVWVNPRLLRSSSAPPRVFVEQVLADQKPAGNWLGEWIAGSLRPAHPPGAPLVLGPGRGELEFHYTALDFHAPEELHFKYRLEGADAQWTDAGSRREAHYINVAPGNYRFHVIACNQEGLWNQEGAVVALVLRPHLWQTWWYRTAAGLLLLGAATGSALLWARRRMRRQLERLEQRHAIERERGRIAKDIHDDLGSSLTRIMMLGERAEDGLGKREDVGLHVGKIVATARGSVQALDEIVWAVNPENDTLEGLVEYISHYVDEFFENVPISCRLEIPVQLPRFSLSAEVRHGLFLVVKEALNNVAKHARASEVRVEVSVAEADLQVLVEDNGRGFDPAQPAPERKGNGLGNMRKRLEALGGRLELLTAPGQGTRLKLSVPLKRSAEEKSKV